MQGLHLIADLRGCARDRPLMLAPDALRAACLDAVASAGLHAVGELFHRFEPIGANLSHCAPPRPVSGTRASANEASARAEPVGITGVVLLAESHLAVHTWPEIDAATLDVYVCNFGADNTARAHALFDALLAAFAPNSVQRQTIVRGGTA